MPIIRKLTTVGDSRGVTLPKSWIEYYEKQFGRKITEVFMETNGGLGGLGFFHSKR
jgi:hypothetical protein